MREYNQSYNFFQGMSDEDVLEYQKDAITGHRPTWKMGTGKNEARENSRRERHRSVRSVPRMGGHGRAERRRHEAGTRTIRNAERKAFNTLGLEISVTPQQIKARFRNW